MKKFMNFLNEKTPSIELRLSHPEGVELSDGKLSDPFYEFFEALASKDALEICIATPFNSPEPFKRLFCQLSPPAKGRHLLRLVTTAKDQAHFPKIKGLARRMSAHTEMKIHVIPAAGTCGVPEDTLHCKMFLVSRREIAADAEAIPLEAFFGSANFTWRGVGCAPDSPRPESGHSIELVARLLDPQARMALRRHFERLFNAGGPWKPKAARQSERKTLKREIQ